MTTKLPFIGILLFLVIAVTAFLPIWNVHGTIDTSMVSQKLDSVGTAVETVHQITVYEAFDYLDKAILSRHFSSDKHQGDNPNPNKIREMIRMGACNPIKVYECVDWNHRVKFICPITPEIEVGLSISLDPEVDCGALCVTAFPSTASYWDGAGVEGCNLIGTVVHP